MNGCGSMQKRILLVEDDREISKLITDFLEQDLQLLIQLS